MSAFDNAIADFLKHTADLKGFSNFTKENYKRDLNQFKEFLQQKYPYALEELVEIKPLIVRTFLANLRESGYKPSSIERKAASLRAFFGYLYRSGILKLNPANYVLIPKKEKKLPSFFEPSQLDTAFKSINGENILIYRDRVIFELLYATGIRLRELASLKVNDISLARMELKVVGKGKKERIVPFGEPAKIALEKYLAARKTILKEKDDHGFLLLNKNGAPLGPRGIEYIVRKYMLLVPGAKRNPHTFRHTFATHLLSSGAPILVVKELLGHSTLSTTQIYTHIQLKQLKDAHKKSHPRG